MQGALAQTIGLVLSVNARARGLAYPRWPDASIYAFCSDVTFREPPRRGMLGGLIGGRGEQVRADPEAWLETLPRQATARLVSYPRYGDWPTDLQTVGFANGGPLFVLHVRGWRSADWHGTWEVHDGAADGRIWSVAYEELPKLPPPPPTPSAQAARATLHAVLEQALAFDAAHAMGFGAYFERALVALDAPAPRSDTFHADLLAGGVLDGAHAQLFAAAAEAWVFGGMGWWNDAGFDGDTGIAYTALTDRLFDAVIAALVVATNASARAGG